MMIMWLNSILISLGMDVSSVLAISKAAADRGFKFNSERLENLADTFREISSESMMYTFLPFINIIKSYQNSLEYNNNREMILNQLFVLGAIEDMSKLEKEEYSKKPTGLHAIMTPFIVESRLANAKKLEVVDGSRRSEILYEISEDDVIILRVDGPLKNSDIDMDALIKPLIKDGTIPKKVNLDELFSLEDFKAEDVAEGSSNLEDIQKEIQDYKSLKEELTMEESQSVKDEGIQYSKKRFK